MNCIIIEDQAPARRILKKYIADAGSLQLKGEFSDAMQAMEFLKASNIDLIFLDIHLPKLSGIDFLKSMPNPPHVILTTAFPDYALEGYDLNVVDYLLKPFSFQRFVKAVAKVPERRSPRQAEAQPAHLRNEIFIKSGYEHIKIRLDDILYIKSDADYTEIFLPHKKYVTSEPLRYWLEQLDPTRFVRVHKSYIIHSAKIEKIVGNQIYLTGKAVVPIGRAYKEGFMNRFVR